MRLEEAETLGRRAAAKAQEYILEVLGLTPGVPVSTIQMNNVALGMAYCIAHLDAVCQLQCPHLSILELRKHSLEVSDAILDRLTKAETSKMGAAENGGEAAPSNIPTE